MSSLLQFNGKVSKKGVNLQAYYVTEKDGYETDETFTFVCSRCREKHPYLFTFWRKPRGMFGCWVVFMYNGEEHVPDLSVPIRLHKMPRDAIRRTWQGSEEIWHSE